MLNIPASTKIYVASEPVDIRKGMDALAGWVEPVVFIQGEGENLPKTA